MSWKACSSTSLAANSVSWASLARYGDEEGAEALFDDAPPPGDEEEGEELFDQNFDVR